MRLHLLDASDLTVSGLGRLAGRTTVEEAMADPRIAGVLTALPARRPAAPGTRSRRDPEMILGPR